MHNVTFHRLVSKNAFKRDAAAVIMISFIISIINLLVSLAILYILLDSNISKSTTSAVSAVGGPGPQQQPGQENAAHLKYRDSLLGTHTPRKEIAPSRLSADKPRPEKNKKEKRNSQQTSSLHQHVGNLDIESGASTNFLFSALPRDYGKAAPLRDDTNHIVFISPPLKENEDNRGEREPKSTSSSGDNLKTNDTSDYDDTFGDVRLSAAKKAITNRDAPLK